MLLIAFLLVALSTNTHARCATRPKIPENSKAANCGLSSNTCTVTCLSDNQFPDGTTVGTMVCRDGAWSILPNCQKSCSKPCINEGTCLANNMCQCPQAYKGPQCQYSTDSCTAENLNFNGNYKCRGDFESFICTVTCPDGTGFKDAVAVNYVCKYETGTFNTLPPLCVYDEDMHVSTNNRQKYYELSYKTVNNMTVPEYINYETREVTMVKYEPSICFAWGDGNIKTFDGKIYSASSDCEEMLALDLENIWSVSVLKRINDNFRSIHIAIDDEDYTITKSNTGALIVITKNKENPIPIELDALKISMTRDSVVIELKYLRVVVRWDTEKLVQVEIGRKSIGNTAGLCGFPNSNPDDDFTTSEGLTTNNLTEFIQSWASTDKCNIIQKHTCTGLDEVAKKADTFCTQLLSDKRFAQCYPLLEMTSLKQACTWDYCACKDSNECACNVLSVVSRNCIFYGKINESNWRNPAVCPKKCTNGKVYMNCEPEAGQPTCTSPGKPDLSDVCTDACYCPVNTYLHKGECISKDKCPCILNGKEYLAGSTTTIVCNTCTCTNGEFTCTTKDCRGVCSAIGDPHYTTFDGFHYDYMGLCNYYLVKIGSVTIEGEHASWSAIASITNAVIIKVFRQTIKLQQKKVVDVNGETVVSLPYYIPGATITTYSSVFVSVEIYNGIQILWNGLYNLYIYLDPMLKGHTRGLCGNYNDNPKDELITSNNTLVTNINVFGDSWITPERCQDKTNGTFNTCEKEENKEFAKKHCGVLKSNLFSSCHKVVDVEPQYQNCLFDMCTCNPNTNCMCPMISTYSAQCANKGVVIDWSDQIKECTVKCEEGQKLKSCSNPCTRTCKDISRGNCKGQCIEGCSCPNKETLNSDNKCIPIEKCSCQYNGVELPAGYKGIRSTGDIKELCTCKNAVMNCKPATKQEVKEIKEIEGGKCDLANNFEFTECELMRPMTCQNMDKAETLLVGRCEKGCQCKKGYVLNKTGKKCITPSECQCDAIN